MAGEVPQLSMSGILAFIAITSNANVYDLTFLKKNDPSYSHFDWKNAEEWMTLLGDEIDSVELQSVCRYFSLKFVLSSKLMVDLARTGRSALVSNLSEDELQVFRNGQLLEKQPSEIVIQWWDQLKLLSRNSLDERLLNQGRLAERWTIDEEKRLLSEFSDLIPEWVALDGDHFGYDILSYRLNDEKKITPIQIEVKSFADKYNPHFYLTKNEWAKALLAGEAFLFYLWCIETKEFEIFNVDDVKRHIPNNVGQGDWQLVLIEGL